MREVLEDELYLPEHERIYSRRQIDARKLNKESDLIPTNKYSDEIRVDINSNWEVFTHGGRKPTGIDAVKWAKKVNDLGCGEILLTSMDSDGQESGYDIALLEAVSTSVTVPVIASGGAGSLDHLVGAINDGKADAVLAASIFHFGTFSIAEAKNHLKSQGITVRI